MIGSRIATALVFLCAWTVTSFAQIPAKERAVLVNLYNSTSGQNWTSANGWLASSGTECEWKGISCSGNHVTNVDLTENNLIGSLPDLSALSQLQYISVASNELTGSLPDLATLINLRSFDASNNQLSGAIPELSALGQLTFLNLSMNQLVGGIPSLSNLSALQNIGLSNNFLSGTIPDLSELNALYYFDISNNQLSGQIPQVTSSPNLNFLYVDHNALSGSLPSLTGLSQLQEFAGSENYISGEIPDLSSLSSLLYLDLHRNQLSGSIPPLGGMSNINVINLSNNRLTGNLPGVNGLPNLQAILVDHNQLTGPVPTTSGTSLNNADSSLCPNPLSTTPSAQDAGWEVATGISPWWATPFTSNKCDDLFADSFGGGNEVTSYFSLSVPNTTSAGQPFGVSVISLDDQNNLTSYSGPIVFTSSDPSATFPTNASIANGQGTFAITLRSLGDESVTVTASQGLPISGTSSQIAVGGAATHFSVNAPTSASSGDAVSFAVTALDDTNNLVTNYNGTLHFSTSDPSATVPENGTLGGGTGQFAATLVSIGAETITVTDVVNSTVVGVSNTITVGVAPTHFLLIADATAIAGSPANFTVTAKDGANNAVPSYSGSVTFTSSDAQAVLPVNSQLINGTGSFNATFKSAGAQTITATDSGNSTIYGTSNNVLVSATAVASLALDISSPSLVGSATLMHVNPHDQYGNSVTGYTGTLHFTSTDSTATLPPDGAFTNGFYNNVTFNTTGAQTVTATDTGTSSITGTSNDVSVIP